VNPKTRLLTWADRLSAVTLVFLLTGTTATFGGRVWWAPLWVGVLCVALVGLALVRVLLEGSMPVLKSPLTGLGVLALGLAVGQLVPLPARVSERVAPAARLVYATGYLPNRARALDPEAPVPTPAAIRAPASLDRPATLRWLAGAAGCLAVFWAVTRFADRLQHLYLVWGAVVAGFFLNTAVAVVQLVCGAKAKGLYGFIEPGLSSSWAPTVGDLLGGPGASVLRAAGSVREGHPAWALVVPDRPFLIGTQIGGAGAYLALGSVALPLALGLTLQILAPRGSREPLSQRLGQTGQGSLLVLVFGMLLASSWLVGLLAGPWYGAVFGLALVFVGLPSARGSGLGWTAVGLTFLALTALASGAAVGVVWADSRTFPPPVSAEDIRAAARVWNDALPIVRDFPLAGTGLGTFATIYPAYKTQDAASSTAMSSLLQWWVEAGYVGLGLLAVGLAWCLWRLPGAVRRVGSADRALAFGLIGAAVGFTVFSAIHWTVELASVALAASALAGACNRWLAGGTDLFVERV
jgi:O-antigen ligase